MHEISAWDMWDPGPLNVLIIPPAHGPLFGPGGVLQSGDPGELTPFNTYLTAVEDSIAAWSVAVQTFGSADLRRSFQPHVYVLGRDVPPAEALSSPDIVITTNDETVLGLGYAFRPYPCFVNNSEAEGIASYADIFNINGQEYGHCLGVNHVGSQGGVDPTSPLQHPEHDIMNGFYTHDVGDETTHLHCISNLDVLALNYVFAHKNPGNIPVLNRETADLSMHVDNYRTTCGADGLDPSSRPPYPPAVRTSSGITSPSDGQGMKARKLVGLTGYIEGNGASHAELALVLEKGERCKWWNGIDSFRFGDCEEPKWFPTTKGRDWTYTPPVLFPSGSYRLTARAVDADMGVIEEDFEQGRNLISFSLR